VTCDQAGLSVGKQSYFLVTSHKCWLLNIIISLFGADAL